MNARRHRCAAPAVDRVSLEPLSVLNKVDATTTHRDSGRGEAVGIVDVGAVHGIARNILHRSMTRVGIVDVVTANVAARCRDAGITGHEYLDDFCCREWVANSDAPPLPQFVVATALDIAARLDAVVEEVLAVDEATGVADRPALHQSGGGDATVGPANVEETKGLVPREL